MAFVRVKSSTEELGWEQFPIVVDLKVQRIDDVMRAIGDPPRFGAVGRQRSETYRPFRMDNNVNIDFGSPSELRNAHSNVLEREIEPGSYCTCRDAPNEPEMTYGSESF